VLEVSGAVLVSVDGYDAAVTAKDSTITIEVRNPRHFFKRVRRTPKATRANAGRLVGALQRAGITLIVTSRGKRLIAFGAPKRSGVVSKLIVWLLKR
jgi:hypothetical protein